MSSNTSDGLPGHIPAELKKRAEALRDTGHFGGVISPHRALLTIPLRARDLLLALLLALLLLAGYVFSLEWLATGWTSVLRWCLTLFGYEDVRIGSFGFGAAGIDVSTPYLELGAAVPNPAQWTAAVVLTAIVLLLSIPAQARFLPLAYLLRALALMQAVALVYFRFWPNYYPYGLAGYHALMMLAGVGFIGIVPLVYGLTYFIFDVGLVKKLSLTLGTMLYLAVLIPLQYFAHAYLIHRFSLLYMPILFLMFGLMIDVFMLIAFYAWAMSWGGKVHPHEDRHSAVAQFPVRSD